MNLADLTKDELIKLIEKQQPNYLPKASPKRNDYFIAGIANDSGQWYTAFITLIGCGVTEKYNRTALFKHYKLNDAHKLVDEYIKWAEAGGYKVIDTRDNYPDRIQGGLK